MKEAKARLWQSSLPAVLALVVANFLQHFVHPDLDVLERAAVEQRGADWAEKFYVYDVSVWTPGHEVMSQALVGKFIYLTVQVLALQLGYSIVCAVQCACAAAGGHNRPLARFLCQLAPLVDGLGVCVFALYSVFAFLQTFIVPAWRSQWDTIETEVFRSCTSEVCVWVCRNYGSFMHVLHFSGALGAVLDLPGKDPHLVVACTPTWPTVFLALAAYTVLFHCFLFYNFQSNKGAIPYPWYYDLRSPLDFVVYLLFVNFIIFLVVQAVRRWALARATRACELHAKAA